MARAALTWSTSDLAKAADVGVNTVNRFEQGQDARISSMESMRRALTAAGVEFIPENGGGAGVRLRKQPGNIAETQDKIDALHEHADAIDTSGPASPRKALNTMKQAIARNDARKLKARANKKD